MLLLARQCGINSAISKVPTIGECYVLLVKRFDRQKVNEEYLHSRMISALLLLQAENTHQSREKCSYVLLTEAGRRICAKPTHHATELFCRMCCKVFISITDDRLRNHAFITHDHNWQLSSAFDLTPTPLISREHRDLAIICGNQLRYPKFRS